MASSDDIVTIKEMGDKRPWWQYLDATKWKLFIAALIAVSYTHLTLPTKA